MDAREWFVDTGEVSLCVQGFGDPWSPAIVLVAGAAASMDCWEDDLCARLAEGGRHVVRYDHRDTGRSTTGPPGAPGYDGAALERDCLALLESLGPEPVHLAGLSMGGGIAQAVAQRRPDLVATLTLACTSPVGGVAVDLPGPAARAQEYFADPPAEPDWTDVEAYADWVLAGERAFAGSLPLDEASVRASAARVHARSADPAAAGNHWLVVAGDGNDEDTAEPLDVRRIGAPTLVVHGTDDPLFPPAHGEALAAAVPDARLLLVPGMGHQVPPPATWDLLVPAVLAHTAGRCDARPAT